MKDLRRLSVLLPLSLHTRFKLACVADGVLMTDVVRQLLEQKLGPDRRGGTKATKAAKTARGEVRA